MQQREVSPSATATGRIVLALIYGLLIIVSVFVVVTQVRLSGVTAVALSIALTVALLAGWEECRAGWALLCRVVTATIRR